MGGPKDRARPSSAIWSKMVRANAETNPTGKPLRFQRQVRPSERRGTDRRPPVRRSRIGRTKPIGKLQQYQRKVRQVAACGTDARPSMRRSAIWQNKANRKIVAISTQGPSERLGRACKDRRDYPTSAPSATASPHGDMISVQPVLISPSRSTADGLANA